MISDFKISNQINKYSKCNINCYKDFKLFNPNNKLAKMPDINKPHFKTLDTCSIIKFNLFNKKKLK